MGCFRAQVERNGAEVPSYAEGFKLRWNMGVLYYVYSIKHLGPQDYEANIIGAKTQEISNWGIELP